MIKIGNQRDENPLRSRLNAAKSLKKDNEIDPESKTDDQLKAKTEEDIKKAKGKFLLEVYDSLPRLYKWFWRIVISFFFVILPFSHMEIEQFDCTTHWLRIIFAITQSYATALVYSISGIGAVILTIMISSGLSTLFKAAIKNVNDR